MVSTYPQPIRRYDTRDFSLSWHIRVERMRNLTYNISRTLVKYSETYIAPIKSTPSARMAFDVDSLHLHSIFIGQNRKGIHENE